MSKRELRKHIPLREYIEALPQIENDIASHVNYKHGNASFWYEDGYVLVLCEDRLYNEDTYVYSHPRFWGNEELNDYNDLRLTVEELLHELEGLEEPDLDNYYGMNAIFDLLGKER